MDEIHVLFRFMLEQQLFKDKRELLLTLAGTGNYRWAATIRANTEHQRGNCRMTSALSIIFCKAGGSLEITLEH